MTTHLERQQQGLRQMLVEVQQAQEDLKAEMQSDYWTDDHDDDGRA